MRLLVRLPQWVAKAASAAQPDNRRRTAAEAGSEIDAASAEREKAKAEEEMKTAGAESLGPIRARLDLAEARISAARR